MKRNTRRILALFTTMLMVVTILAGCSQGTAATQATMAASEATMAESTTVAENEPVTLTLLVDKDSPVDGLNAVIALAKEKLNIDVQLELRPGGSEGENILKTRLATGDATDLIWFNAGSLLGTINPAQNLVDLTNEPFMQRLDAGFVRTVTVDGKAYGVPTGSSLAGGWLYNKAIYKELGLSVPKTWDELIANCEIIKATGKTAVIGSYKDDWTSQLILLGDFFNVNAQLPNFADDFTNNKAKFATTPIALRGFEKLQEINTKGFLNKDYLATTYDIGLKMLATGEGAHYPMLTFALPTIEKNYPDQIDDIGFFAQPGDDAASNGLTVWYPAGIYVYNKSEKIDAAKKFLDFYISDEALAAYAAVQKARGPFVVKGATLPEDSYGAVKDMLVYFDEGNTSPALEFLSPVKGPNSPQICVEAGSNIKPALDCAKEYDQDVAKQAKQLGLAGW